jgi:hypothetical protein
MGLASSALAAAPIISAISPQSGGIGTAVTLTGQNFGVKQNKAAVNFGTSAATITSWSGSKIIAKAPTGKGQVQVTVVNSTGTASVGKTFTYTSTSGLINFKVFANNNLGMHCVDKDFSVFSILPPFNVVNAQVVAQNQSTGKTTLLNSSQVVLRYSKIADAAGSVNSTSKGKSNFWQYAGALFGANLSEGQGLTGLYMPADATANAQKQFSWNTDMSLFVAEGIPIFPVDDAGSINRYPVLRMTAYDKLSGQALAYTDTVLPVSEETTCSGCHASGQAAAQGTGWSNSPDLEVQTRTNVLIGHDKAYGTQLQNSQPVLCASCHYSAALDLAGTGPSGPQMGNKTMSSAMHAFHSQNKPGFTQINGLPLYDQAAPVAGLAPALKGIPPAAQQTCYQCHPGKDTKCLRGAMTATVTCQNCHGGMAAVGGTTPLKGYGSTDSRTNDLQRHPWMDEPRCQSCHTGDMVSHFTPGVTSINDPASGQAKILDNTLDASGLRLTLAHDRQDPAASPLLAVNKRFAENDGQLFRFSKGHGQVACEGCHGSTHAIWPGDANHPNDNTASIEAQGHVGTISECASCHNTSKLTLGLNGPHGMHLVNDRRWHSENGHASFYKQNPTACKTCHGTDLKGSVLSRVAADRSYQTEWGTKTRLKGQSVGCWTCHNGPNGD